MKLTRPSVLHLLGAVGISALAVLPLFAQDAVDPFADPGAEPTPTTAATPAPTLTVDDPFAAPPPTPVSGPVPSDPFAEPAPESTVDNPFASTTTPTPARPAVSIPVGVRGIEEVRGLYVLASDRGIQNSNQLQELVRDAGDASFTRLYVEVRTTIGVAYQSALEEPLPSISVSNPNPLADLRAGLDGRTRVIAVVHLLPAYTASTGSRPPQRNPIGRFPEYTNQTIEGKQVAKDNVLYLDPGDPQVVRYLSAIVAEIDEKVAPDGYLFAGLRYPGPEWGYSAGAVRAFRSVIGGEGPPPNDNPLWSAWRRHQLTELIRTLRDTVLSRRPDVSIGAMVEVTGPPPNTWEEWIASPQYAEYMQDWITWTRDGVVSEIVFQIHERTSSTGNVLRDWVAFAGNNSGSAQVTVSLAGMLNFTSQFTRQIEATRSRGLGTILYHYASPVRDRPRGFWSSLPTVFYKGRQGIFTQTRVLDGPKEDRAFARSFNPPPGVIIATPTPSPLPNLIGEGGLVFTSPTPPPTRTPQPRYVPDQRPREVTLNNGNSIQAVVLEVTDTTITLKEVIVRDGQVASEKSPVRIARSAIRQVEPPL